MSDLSPLSGEERKSNFGAVRSVDDPKPDITLQAPGQVETLIDALALERS
jgi:hypothetical protein